MRSLLLVFTAAILLTACTASAPAATAPSSPSPAATSPTPDTLKVYSLSEVQKHATPTDCWLVLSGKVYNVSNFADKHPGGEAVYTGCGQDATTLFETRPMGSQTPHSDKARALLPNFYLGELAQ